MLLCAVIAAAFYALSRDADAQIDTIWNKKKAEEWFKKAKWLNAKSVQQPVIHYDNFGGVLDETPTDSSQTKMATLWRLNPANFL